METLKAAREKIADPEHWTQGAYSRDAWGAPYLGVFERSVCFCATGAVISVEPRGISSRHTMRSKKLEQEDYPFATSTTRTLTPKSSPSLTGQ